MGGELMFGVLRRQGVFIAISVILIASCSGGDRSASNPTAGTPPFKPPESVEVTAQNPCPYRHPSTFPNSLDHDPKAGHADGVGMERFRGRVVWRKPDGTTQGVAGARFYRVNDSMLLVEGLGADKIREDLGITTEETGAFDFKVSLFAAIGRDRNGEQFVFQTGAAWIRVEADGFEPLETTVCEEQPETTIVLSQSKH